MVQSCADSPEPADHASDGSGHNRQRLEDFGFGALKTQPKPSRILRILKWAGVGICIVMTCAWSASNRWVIGLPRDGVSFTIDGGSLQIYGGADWARNAVRPPQYVLPGSSGSVQRFPLRRYWTSSGRRSSKLHLSGPWTNPWHTVAGKDPYLNSYTWSLNIPLYLVLLSAALPTAFLWYRDRRRIPPGHCQRCGYNLTGNVSGVCSECGTKVIEN